MLQQVPVVGVALGSCAGPGAIKVLMSHFSVMVREQAQVFAAGPPVVRQAYGIEIDENALGGHMVHRKSALVHNEAQSEEDAFRQVTTFLSYLPRHAWERPPRIPCADPPDRADDWLRNAIPKNRRKLFDPRRILQTLEVPRGHPGPDEFAAFVRAESERYGRLIGSVGGAAQVRTN